MSFHTIVRRAEQALKADQAAVCAINRHLRLLIGIIAMGGMDWLPSRAQ